MLRACSSTVAQRLEHALNRLPTWLTRCKVIGSLQCSLAAAGLRAILDASFLAGAGHRHSEYRLVLASLTVADGRLGAFRKRLGITSDDVAPDPLRHLAEIERRCRTKVPDLIKRIAPFLADGEYPRFMELSHTAVLGAMQRFGRLANPLRAEDLIRIAGVVGGPESDGESEFSALNFWSQSTPNLIKAAHSALIRECECAEGIAERDLDALVLLGATCLAIHTIRECRWCFRWTLPGSDLCACHALSKAAGGSPLSRQNAYRRGELARRSLAKARGAPIPLLRPAHIRSDLSLYVARVLWRVTAPDEQETAARLVEQICDPEVGGLLGFKGANLHPCGVDDLLRQQLEPDQWLPFHWEWKLMSAVLIRLDKMMKDLDEQRVVHTVEENLDAAIRVAAKEKCSTLRSVSEHLKVDPSTVSQWLCRSESKEKIKKLRSLIETNHFREQTQPSPRLR